MKKIIIVTLIGILLIPVANLSATRYVSGQSSPSSTIYLNGGDGYRQFNSVYDTKDLVNPTAGWYVSHKSMWSTPYAYMVNSGGSRRSDTASLSSTGYHSVGNNAGQIGYKYYTKVKPSSSQVGKDSIKLNLNADG